MSSLINLKMPSDPPACGTDLSHQHGIPKLQVRAAGWRMLQPMEGASPDLAGTRGAQPHKFRIMTQRLSDTRDVQSGQSFSGDP